MADLIALLLVFVAAYSGAGALKAYALKQNLLDVPNERSSHALPTPRGGGLAIVVVFLCGLALLRYQGEWAFNPFVAMMGGGILVAAIGFWDDHQPVAARWRILVHFAAALWCLVWLGAFPPLPLFAIHLELGGLGYLIGAVFLAWLLNLFNFMDGIDGLAGSEALFIAGAAALLIALQGRGNGDVQALLFLALGCLGFLLWNWPPAKIFMGDVGSGFLGFSLGAMALKTAAQDALSLWSWLILFGVFWVDATVTLLRRMLSGQPWHQPHCSHAYQKAAKWWKSHKRVTLAVWGLNLFWLLPLAFCASLWPEQGLVFLLIAYLPLLGLTLWLDAGKAEPRI